MLCASNSPSFGTQLAKAQWHQIRKIIPSIRPAYSSVCCRCLAAEDSWRCAPRPHTLIDSRRQNHVLLPWRPDGAQFWMSPARMTSENGRLLTSNCRNRKQNSSAGLIRPFGAWTVSLSHPYRALTVIFRYIRHTHTGEYNVKMIKKARKPPPYLHPSPSSSAPPLEIKHPSKLRRRRHIRRWCDWTMEYLTT